MKLRRLEVKDVPYMLEWMKSNDTKEHFKFDFSSMTEEKAESFITASHEDNNNLHLAVVDETDEYLGTISLKNIDYENGNAEYAVSLRKKAIGNGVAAYATEKLLEKAFDELGLHKVYLNVFSDNIRAVLFYEKFGFTLEGEFREHIYAHNEFKTIKWYSILKNDFNAMKKKTYK